MIVEVEASVSLKSCPLCGEPAVMRTEGLMKFGVGHPVPHYWVKCTNERCAISPKVQDSQEAAAESWNRRA
jgi:hypothetical protein